RARFPRDKPCGEFLTPETRRIFERLGVWEDVRRAGAYPVRRAELHAPKGIHADYRPGTDEPAGWSLRRTVLDAVLLNHARSCGAEVREGVSVRGLVKHGASVGGVIADREPQDHRHPVIPSSLHPF